MPAADAGGGGGGGPPRKSIFFIVVRFQTLIPDRIAWVASFAKVIVHTFQRTRCQSSHHRLVGCHSLGYKGKIPENAPRFDDAIALQKM